jgi:cysteinyl-tRNA synthetase
VNEVPTSVRRLAEEREAARRRKDFSAADELRDRIALEGFEVTDTPEGPVLAPRADTVPVARRSEDVPSVLEAPPSCDASVEWIVQGWPEDVVRGIDSFRRYEGSRAVQHVVVEASGGAAQNWPEGVELIRIEPEAGWAAARNAGLRRTRGEIVILVDGSLEASGDVFGPLDRPMRDATVGVTGPFGITTEDMREFLESPGPDVDAIESYLMAFRRELLVDGLRFDEKFKFYRTADIELSFQVKAMELRATVTPVPVRRHIHRVWAAMSEEERARLSKRNYYRFLDRWRGRNDLLVRSKN